MGVFSQIEPVSAVVRVFEDGATPGKDPYIASGTVVYIDRETVEIKGVSLAGDRTLFDWRRPVLAMLREQGIKVVIMHRLRNGKLKKSRIRVNR
ncbi:hypothetical protein [Roseiconus lacunae]|uniref:hypothetical protein n=1 Tax=Roseiconus lacunae TaxID=2605694 RepID=UPI001E587528|nr:hypothetical protein [Roseiconus lacunae]MCD0459124.1 hypothetical protein [Roseiconus lacunae]